MAIQPAPKFANLMGLRVGGDLDGLTYYVNKRGKVTWFAKAPPTKPPTWKQVYQRNAFRLVAILWQQQSDAQRAAYDSITRRASLCMTGYNLFVHVELTHHQDTLRTLERQTGVTIP